MHDKSLQFCPTLCDSMDCSPPGSSAHGILQARILEWVAMPSSRGSSPPRDGTRVSCVSCTGRQVLYHCVTWEALQTPYICANIRYWSFSCWLASLYLLVFELLLSSWKSEETPGSSIWSTHPGCGSDRAELGPGELGWGWARPPCGLTRSVKLLGPLAKEWVRIIWYLLGSES